MARIPTASPQVRRSLGASLISTGGASTGGAIASGLSSLAETTMNILDAQEEARRRQAEKSAAAEGARILAETRLDWTRRLVAAEEDLPADPAGFSDGFLDEFEKDKERRIAAAPELARDAMRERFEAIRGDVGAAAIRVEAAGLTRKRARDVQTAVDLNVNAVRSDYVMHDPALLEVEASIRALGLGEEAEQLALQDSRQKLAVAALQNMNDRAPALAQKALQDGRFDAVLSPKVKDALVGENGVELRRREGEREREQRERQSVLRSRVEAGLKDEVAAIRETGRRAGVVSDAQIRAAWPETADGILAELRTEQEFYLTRQKVGLTSPAEDRALLDRHRPEGEGFAAEADRRDLLADAIRAKYEELAEDPAGYVLQASPAARKMAEAEDPRALSELLLAEQARLGVPEHARRILTEGGAGELVARFQGAESGQERADLVAGLADAYGSHWPRAYRELVGAKLPETAIVLAGMTRPGQARPRVILAEAYDAGEPELRKTIGEDAARGVDDALPDALAPLEATLARTPDGARVSTMYRKATRMLAYQYAREGISPAEAAQRAAADVVTDHYHFEGTYRVPAGVDPAAVERTVGAAMSGLDAAALSAPPSLDPRLQDGDRSRLYAAAVRDKGYWLTNEDETGLLLFDEQGNLVTRADGGPVEVLFDRLAPPPAERQPGDVRPGTIGKRQFERAFPLPPELREVLR